MTGGAGFPAADAGALREAGLCGVCRHVRVVRSGRGSRFYLCRLSRIDDRFPRYPRIPVLRCPGFEPRGRGRDGREDGPSEREAAGVDETRGGREQ